MSCIINTLILVSIITFTLGNTLQSIGFCTRDNQCMNGGTCNATGGCDCIPGFTNDATKGIYNCSLISCANNGTMVNGNCQCPSGWTGFACLRKFGIISFKFCIDRCSKNVLVIERAN